MSKAAIRELAGAILLLAAALCLPGEVMAGPAATGCAGIEAGAALCARPALSEPLSGIVAVPVPGAVALAPGRWVSSTPPLRPPAQAPAAPSAPRAPPPSPA